MGARSTAAPSTTSSNPFQGRGDAAAAFRAVCMASPMAGSGECRSSDITSRILGGAGGAVDDERGRGEPVGGRRFG